MRIDIDISNISEKEALGKITDILHEEYQEVHNCSFYHEATSPAHYTEYEKGYYAGRGIKPPKTQTIGYCDGQFESPECYCGGDRRKCEIIYREIKK